MAYKRNSKNEASVQSGMSESNREKAGEIVEDEGKWVCRSAKDLGFSQNVMGSHEKVWSRNLTWSDQDRAQHGVIAQYVSVKWMCDENTLTSVNHPKITEERN